jgi:3-methylfumaryl-CoA hydratase
VTDVVERTELLTPEPAIALGRLLDVPVPDLEGGEGLPLMWHWIYLLERPSQGDLGADGHPVRGVVPAPAGPGRRRMWGGGMVRSHGTLRVGEQATRRSVVLGTQEKEGRTGRLTLVTVGHSILQNSEVVVEERQDIVYRDAAPGTEPAPPSPDSTPSAEVAVEPGEWSVPVSPTLLFRFSALTYNAHRIHYDLDYTRNVEGYPGLVTHGPLQAMVMAEAARARGVATEPGLTCEYRLVAPLFEHQGLVANAVNEDGVIRTSVRDTSGRRTAQGTISH